MTSGSKEGKGGDSPSQLIDARIKELSDWRGETLARVRILIKQADPELVEEWKWPSPGHMTCVPWGSCHADDGFWLGISNHLLPPHLGKVRPAWSPS